MERKLVGINEFVKRQTPESGKTYSSLSFNKIAEYAEEKLKKNDFKEGYREGVILVSIDNSLTKHFKCPFVKIDSNTKLKAEVKKRRENEDNYISIKALNGKELDVEYIDLVLYRHDVLKETKENSTNFEWELISFHAIPKGIKNMPMGPTTMMRNQLLLTGGTKGTYTSEECANSVHFWQKYALKEK